MNNLVLQVEPLPTKALKKVKESKAINEEDELEKLLE
jgi:hypothetical protein